MNYPTYTSINGVKAEWDDTIKEKWKKIVKDLEEAKITGKITRSNYYTPRPYVDQYNSGSEEEGFCYVMSGEHFHNHVYMAVISTRKYNQEEKVKLKEKYHVACRGS